MKHVKWKYYPKNGTPSRYSSKKIVPQKLKEQNYHVKVIKKTK